MTTVVLVDDHPLVREGLHRVLGSAPQISVIGEAHGGRDAIDVIEQLKPDVVLLDLTMPDVSGIQVLRRIRQTSPGTRVLVLSMHGGEGYVLEALRNDATGYALKSIDGDELIGAVRQTAAGVRYLSPPLDDRRLIQYATSADRHKLDLYETLTRRERDVLELAAESLNNTQIGERLAISPRTVETHRTSMMHKLGIRTQTDLVRFALKQGICRLSDARAPPGSPGLLPWGKARMIQLAMPQVPQRHDDDPHRRRSSG